MGWHFDLEHEIELNAFTRRITDLDALKLPHISH